jgi:histidinol phosphatase-like enzyme
MWGCKVNTFYTDYVIVTKKDGVKDTISYSYWNEFEMEDSKLEWMLANKGINIKDVQVVDFIQGPKTKFNKRYQLK